MATSKEYRVELYVNFLFPGIVLKGAAYTDSGEKIQDGGVPFTRAQIDELKQKRIKRVYYTKKMSPKEPPSNPLPSNESMEKAIDITKEMVQAVENKQMIPEKAMNDMVAGFIEDISQSEGTTLNLQEIKDLDDYTYAHSINVCLIAILFAKRLSYNAKGLKIIGVGALLHDIGKLLLPQGLLNKTPPLKQEEIEIIRKHPIFGYEYIRGQSSYGSLIQKIVLLHHERYNGKGYPFGIRGEEVGEIAQIIGIADTFDSITSENAYKQARPYWYALIQIYKSSGRSFSPRLAKNFVQDMPRFLTEEEIFPLGGYVVLNSGEVGEVIDYRYPQTLKPVVNILINGKREIVRYPIPIDLHFDDSRFIENVLEDEGIIQKMEEIKKKFKKSTGAEAIKEAMGLSEESTPEPEEKFSTSTVQDAEGIPEEIIEETIPDIDRELFEDNESELK